MFTAFAALVLLGDLATPRIPPSPIIDGTPATEADYPMAGALLAQIEFTPEELAEEDDVQLPPSFVIFYCSSSLIAPDVVLTAAHCILQQEEVAAVHWSRSADLSAWAADPEYGQIPPVEPPPGSIVAVGTVRHPDFEEIQVGDGLGQADDIGLVFLAEPVTDVPFAVIPEGDDDGVALDVPATAIGWGQQAVDDDDAIAPPPAGTKRSAATTISGAAAWEILLGSGNGGPRQCYGDSGGPTFLQLDADDPLSLRQIGVASRIGDGVGCSKSGVISTRVSQYRGWIEEQMIAACADGTRVSCESPGLPSAPAPEGEDSSGSDDGTSDGGAAMDSEDAGCGCTSGGSGPGGVLAMLLLLLARRYRSTRT